MLILQHFNRLTDFYVVRLGILENSMNRSFEKLTIQDLVSAYNLGLSAGRTIRIYIYNLKITVF